MNEIPSFLSKPWGAKENKKKEISLMKLSLPREQLSTKGTFLIKVFLERVYIEPHYLNTVNLDSPSPPPSACQWANLSFPWFKFTPIKNVGR